MGDFSADKLFLFAIFALPGAVAIRVYSLWHPVPQKDWKESITDALIYSSVIAAGWLLFAPATVSGFLSGVSQKDAVSVPEAIKTVIDNRVDLAVYLLVSPAVLSLVWHWVRRRAGSSIAFDHPIRTAWDWAFDLERPVYVLFHLKTKTPDNKQDIRVGYFSNRSYVTSYPHEPEIFVERVHELTSTGGVGPEILDTSGMLMKMADCERLEFLIDPESAWAAGADAVKVGCAGRWVAVRRWLWRRA